MNNLEWFNGEHIKLNWKDAINYCEELGDGWRLPTIEELLSLVDHKKHAPVIDINKYPYVKSDYYWSSTSYANNSGYAWYVDMFSGSVNVVSKTYTRYVWPVRTVK